MRKSTNNICCSNLKNIKLSNTIYIYRPCAQLGCKPGSILFKLLKR